MADIFLSYSRVDRAKAQVIAKNLEAEGFSVWWDKVLRAGQTYDEVTEGMLRNAKAVVVLWSQTSVKSKWVRAEATLGERSSAVVPAMIEDADRPILFELVQTADLIGWDGDRSEERWKVFVDDLKLAIGLDPDAAPEEVSKVSDPIPEEPSEVTPPPPPPPEETLEEQYWNAIESDDDLEALRSYLENYPDGRHADEARSRIAALEAAEQKARDQAAREQAQREDAARKAQQEQLEREQAEKRARAERERAAAAQAKMPKSAERPDMRGAMAGHSESQQKEDSGSSPNLMIIGGIAAVVLLGGAGGAWFMLGGSGDSTANTDPGDVAELAESDVPGIEETAENSQPVSEETPDEAVDAEIEGQSDVDALNDDGSDTLGEEIANAAEDSPETNPDTASDEAAGETSAEPVEEDTPVEEPAVEVFADCEFCPEMKILTDNSFTIGSPETERGHAAYEGPQRELQPADFAIGIGEVTFDQWDACVEAGGCGGYSPVDRGYGRGDQPVLSISFNDARAYVRWLSDTTGRSYRLPSEVEWEYAARGGTQTAYWWGNQFDRTIVNRREPEALSELPENPFGLKGTLGNVSEWVADCYVSSYDDHPVDGRAITDGDCARRVMRGGAWNSDTVQMRSANRSRIPINIRDRSYGFRVATSDISQD